MIDVVVKVVVVVVVVIVVIVAIFYFLFISDRLFVFFFVWEKTMWKYI